MFKIFHIETKSCDQPKDLLIKYFKRISYSACLGSEAEARLEAWRPQVVLLGLCFNNKAICLHLAEKLETVYKLPFIYLTEPGQENLVNQLMAENPAPVLFVPLKEAPLVSVINKLTTAASKSPKNVGAAQKLKGESTWEKGKLFIKSHDSIIPLNKTNILWVKASNNYIEIHATQKTHLIRGTFKGFLHQIGPNILFRVHRSFAINLSFLEGLHPTYVLVGKERIPIAKKYAVELQRMMRVI